MSIQKEMDSIANNIANSNTTAYKADRVTFNSFMAQPPGSSKMAAMIFPKLAAAYRETKEGTISNTGNPLDVAIRGEGYMVVDTPQGQRYTRDGHLSLDTSGRLVNPAGRPILGLPMAYDQFDNAALIERLGAGTYVARAQVAVPKLASALDHLIANPHVSASLQVLQQRMRRENGAFNAAVMIDRHMRKAA